MTAQTRARRPLIARLATVAITAGLVAGAVGITTDVGAPASDYARTTAAAPSIEATPSFAAQADARGARTTAAPTSPPAAVARSGRTATKAAAARVARPAARRTVYIRSYLDRMGSQAAVDTGKLVLWWDKPYWLAGHNYRGWQWMAFVPTGTKVIVSSGRAAGTYTVTGHQRLDRQSGALPRVRADLVLQTCVGEQTGLTLLRRA
jgi:nucleoid-associated protein YgaU